MKGAIVATVDDLGDRLGDVLADRFLYHFVVRRYAQLLLGGDDEWGGLSILPSGSDQRSDRPDRSQ